MLHRLLFILLTAVVLSACTPSITRTVRNEKRLDDLRAAMTGSYDSSLQASADSSYYNITLHMEPIWTDGTGHYLYVEQALASMQDKPYRQRVYKLETSGRKVISAVYELPEPARFVGAHKEPELLEALSPADLIKRDGCAVIMKQDKDGIYRGQTRKKDCKSTLRGATYATSRVSMDKDFIQSWDRGWNEEGEQVWGAEKGGYMFFKVRPAEYR